MNLLNPIQSLLFPVFCGICTRPADFARDGTVCASCWNQTRIFDGRETVCHKCGRYHSDRKPGVESFCRRCENDFYDLARSIGPYDTALAVTVLQLKRVPFVAKRPIELLFDAYVSGPFRDIDLVIPIPLSKKRRLDRGFNQAEIVAKRFAAVARLRVDRNSLFRKKHVEISRASLDRRGRAMTVENAFGIKRSSLIRNKNVLLVDDVFTSGATVSMAAKALKKGGAARVEVLTLARA